MPGRQGSRSQRPGSVLSKSPAQRFWGQVRTALYALSLFSLARASAQSNSVQISGKPSMFPSVWKWNEQDNQCPIQYLEGRTHQAKVESSIDQNSENERITNSIGDVEEFGYRNGQIWNGKGKKTYLNGIVEEGTFIGGMLNGEGKKVVYGDFYEGTFENDKIDPKEKRHI